ncbi:MAG: CDP-alcohol phosphatidyltransferase family protein, partial [Erythrobacter sp.]
IKEADVDARLMTLELPLVRSGTRIVWCPRAPRGTAVARVRGPSDLGGYFDIVADFAFYVAIPLAFGALAPANTLPALVLVASFVLTGVSFLAFATIAAKRGAETDAHGRKSFFYSTGLAEGGETIAVFIAMCLFPAWFGVIAYAYAGLCVLTVIQRSALAIALFRD